jgi:hypothetical protein
MERESDDVRTIAKEFGVDYDEAFSDIQKLLL